MKKMDIEKSGKNEAPKERSIFSAEVEEMLERERKYRQEN